MNILVNEVFREYKDIHKDERVFLIGNGPSLAETDLNLLKSEKTIAMNRISMMYEKTKTGNQLIMFTVLQM